MSKYMEVEILSVLENQLLLEEMKNYAITNLPVRVVLLSYWNDINQMSECSLSTYFCKKRIVKLLELNNAIYNYCRNKNKHLDICHRLDIFDDFYEMDEIYSYKSNKCARFIASRHKSMKILLIIF